VGRLGFAPLRRKLGGLLRAASEPMPLSAEVSTTSQPSARLRRSMSIRSLFSRTTSIMFSATTTGMPSSVSWVVR
jgi:hypothetical protein